MRAKRFASIIVSILILSAMILSSFTVYGAEEDPSELFGTAEYYSTYTAGTTLTDSFYYSDEWFLEDPGVQNDSLALLSMQLIASVVEGDENGTGITFLKKLGFEQTGLFGFDDPDPEGCAYAWGTKTIGTGEDAFTLAAVVIQSHSLDQNVKQNGWKQNFLVNSETKTAEHFSYSLAADKAEDSILALGSGKKVKYWIMGQSRGGAIAGILASRLKEYASGVFAYTFEAPASVEAEAVPDNEQDYGYIHNYYCSDDVVTMTPPWGMIRYGVMHKLNTEETTEQLAGQLEKLGSDAADTAEEFDGENIENVSSRLIAALTERIPSREAYSQLYTDVFTDAEGNEVSISYSYQDILTGLMAVVFGNVMEGVSADSVLADLEGLIYPVSSLRRAVMEGSDSDYYEAAKGLGAFLEKAGINLPLTVESIYAILKLAGPSVINLDYTSESGEITVDNVFIYISPALELFASKGLLVFSHHFDTIIARLKVLAEEPALENIDIVIPDPEAGDDAAADAKAAVNAIDELDCSWISASAEWESDDEFIQNDKVYYLDVNVSSVGHSIPDDLMITINGKEPEKPFETAYADGVTVVTGTWAFTAGSPQEFSVSFDPGGHEETPETVYVKNGERLKYAIDPVVYETVSDSEGTFRFKGWYDDNGILWEDIYVNEDITLHVSWVQIIDDIEISFEIPHVGEMPEMPEAPEGASYKIESYLEDADWNTVEMAENTDPMKLNFTIYPVSDDLEFLTVSNEYGDYDYAGVLLVNGEEPEAYYHYEENDIGGYYEFTPLP